MALRVNQCIRRGTGIPLTNLSYVITGMLGILWTQHRIRSASGHMVSTALISSGAPSVVTVNLLA